MGLKAADGLEGNGGTPSVIFANAEIQKYNQTSMEPRIREVDQGTGVWVLACLSSFLPLRSLRLGGENDFKSNNLTAKTQSSLRSRDKFFFFFFLCGLGVLAVKMFLFFSIS